MHAAKQLFVHILTLCIPTQPLVHTLVYSMHTTTYSATCTHTGLFHAYTTHSATCTHPGLNNYKGYLVFPSRFVLNGSNSFSFCFAAALSLIFFSVLFISDFSVGSLKKISFVSTSKRTINQT